MTTRMWSGVMVALVFGGCGGSKTTDSAVPGTTDERSGADLIEMRGTPVAFTMQCSRARANGQGTWGDAGVLNRVDMWLYPAAPAGAEAFVIYNGQIIRSGPLAHDLSGLGDQGLQADAYRIGTSRSLVLTSVGGQSVIGMVTL